MNIQALSQIKPPTSVSDVQSAPPNVGGNSGASFADVMVDVVQSTNQEMQAADLAISDYQTGKTDDLNSVVMASVKSDLSFRFLLEMRNRVTESYQELSRMQF